MTKYSLLFLVTIMMKTRQNQSFFLSTNTNTCEATHLAVLYFSSSRGNFFYRDSASSHVTLSTISVYTYIIKCKALHIHEIESERELAAHHLIVLIIHEPLIVVENE